ncbi:hypothetical protein POL68_24140 [Stigmatella sp. ncwal1]|uniref:Uncharacterized protein n=1 Tax=Stigmatella ashevillensis TaxID=2995309 RepID=A0ABT5DD32_9BACT|nr:hypothetical protein [Stigmatella ashevillena]MDC0711582.1 hypothetical protein [Stigmatella ashevillena]
MANDQRPPPELRTLRLPAMETDPLKIRAKRLEVIYEFRNVHGAKRPPTYEGYVFDKVLAENQAALARSRVALHSMNPDVIVGMERGGSFLTEALTQGEPILAAKVRKMRVHRAPEGQPSKKGKYDGPKMQAEFQALINGGAKEIVVYDAYMGGTTARSLIKQVFTPLAEKNPGVTFHMYWLRETFGFRGAEVVGLEKAHILNTVEEVSLVLGDDLDVVMSPNGQASIRLFNSEGKVTEVVTPKPGQTTRQVLIELLNRPSSPTQPLGGGSGVPVVPAHPDMRPAKENMAIRTLRYVTGVGTLSVAEAYEKAETIAAILRPWYQSGKLKGYRSCALVDEESYDEVMLDPEVVEPKVKGRFPFVCVSITFEESGLPSGTTAPSGWDAVVATHALEPL